MITFSPLIYLHGFLSGPSSPKALQTAEYFRTYHPNILLIIPQLPGNIEMAVHTITDLVQRHGLCHFIGNSLGGLLASWAVEQFGGKAVLVNPAVQPISIKAQFIGWHENLYTGEKFYVDEATFSRLQALEPQQINPERYWVLLQKGDEVLDYRLAQSRYQQAKITLEEGGNHAFEEYGLWLPHIAQFFNYR